MIKYYFSNQRNASAAGCIEYIAKEPGRYSLCWDSDAPKEEPLPVFGTLFSRFLPLAVNDVAKKGPVSLTVHTYTVIPEGVTRLLLMREGEPQPIEVYRIPKHKQFCRGKKQYTFGSISDIHLNSPKSTDEEEIRELAQKTFRFRNAIDLLCKNGASLIASSGDLTSGGARDEFDCYKTLLDECCLAHPDINVYTTNGNHDTKRDFRYIADVGCGSKHYTGPLTAKYYDGNEYDFTVSVGDDIFVFYNQRDYEIWDGKRHISDADFAWFEARFEENRGKRIFFYTHPFLDNTNGDASNGFCQYSLPIFEGTEDDVRLRRLLRKYKNVIMLTGHTHWIYEMQDLFDHKKGMFNKNANITDGGGEYGTLVHNGSICISRKLSEKGTEYVYLTDTYSEAYLVDVFENAVIFYGYDLLNDKLYGRFSYLVETKDLSWSADAFVDTVWTISSARTSILLSVNGCNATLFIAKDGVSRTIMGAFCADIEGHTLTVGGESYRVDFSSTHASLALYIDDEKYELDKDAAASAALCKIRAQG
ncbi:MAG: metallophosphoesterase [Clostridia bacterium]|nr:metallophosphoesterase [Clostridia bacterium]